MMDNDNAPRPVNADTEQVCAECASRATQADDAQARRHARCVMLAGHELELDAGDSLARMERVARGIRESARPRFGPFSR